MREKGWKGGLKGALPKSGVPKSGIWATRLWSLCAGLAAGLAHPPFGVLPGLLGYALMLALLDRAANRRSGFLRGWLAGVGYFLIGAWWVVEPFMVDAKTQGWIAPFALVLMASGLALFWGAAGALYQAVKPRGFQRVLVFAGCLALLEWARGHVLTGFPWNLPGETWRAGSAPSQAAAVLGAYGLTWVTAAVAAAPALLFDAASRRARGLAMAATASALACLYGFGLGRLSAAIEAPAGQPMVRVVQANIDQKDKWRPENLEQILETYLELTRLAPVGPASPPDIVIWPEGALPAVIDDLLAPGQDFGSRLVASMRSGQILMMGANRAETGPDGAARYFNSLVAFRRESVGLRVMGIYDKHRLVPFGEFMPLGRLATKVGFRSLVHMPDDFTAGPAPEPLALPGAPAVQPLICYEALFPGFVSKAARRAGGRPAWILNVSNDAWFGVTSGPLQHLNIASYRAIEEGLPIVRATPTGVSAVIDAYGRSAPQARLGLGAMGVIDARLPAALRSTVYARFGDAIFAALLALSLLCGLWRHVR